MSFSYTLDIATSESTPRVANRLAHVASEARLLPSPPPPATALMTKGVPTAHGTLLRVLEEDGPDPGDPLVANLGFAPTTTVILRYKKGTYEEQDDDVLLVSRLLDEIPGDAVLHVDYESAKIVRRAGRTSLSDDAELWTPHRISLVVQECDRTTFTID